MAEYSVAQTVVTINTNGRKITTIINEKGETERWVRMDKHHGSYAISDRGRMILTERHGRYPKGHSVTWQVSTTGYHRSIFTVNNKRTELKCHKLVALYFLGEAPLDDKGKICTVNHIDGVKTNCNVNNLEYISRAANTRHAYATGLTRRSLSPEAVRAMRILKNNKGFSADKLAELAKVSKSLVYDVCTFRTYKDVV